MNSFIPDEVFEWYFIDRFDDNKVKGPVSERDLDVMWKTNSINSQTLVWKQGMSEWKTITDIEDLRRKINDSNIEVVRDRIYNKTMAAIGANNNATGHNAKEAEEAEPETLEAKLEKISRAKPYKGNDGLWHYMDPITKEMRSSEEDPTEALVDEDLLEELVQRLDQEGDEKKSKEKGPHDKKKKKKVPEIDYTNLTEEQIKKIEKNRKKAKKAQEKKKKKWYHAKINSNVYVRGLPEDITKDEMNEFFSRAGIIRVDPQSGEQRIKIYKDEQGRPKGDALISYAKEESVQIALDMLNDREIKPKYKIYIEKANFEQKGDYVPRKIVKVDELTKLKVQSDQERLFSWGDEEDLNEGLRIVIIKNMFSPEEAEVIINNFEICDDLKGDENFFEDLKREIIEECEAKLGEVQRILIFENNPEGVVQIKFKKPTSAEECIKLMNGRYFAGKCLECFYWDGKTDYRHYKEDIEDEKKRLEEFGAWLEKEEKKTGAGQQKDEN